MVSVLPGNEILLVTAKCGQNALLGGRLCGIFNSVVSLCKLFQQMLFPPMCIHKYKPTEQEKKKEKKHQERKTKTKPIHKTTINSVKKLASMSIPQKHISD